MVVNKFLGRSVWGFYPLNVQYLLIQTKHKWEILFRRKNTLGLFWSRVTQEKKKSPTFFFYKEQYLICGLFELLKANKKIQYAYVSLNNESGDYSSSSLDLFKDREEIEGLRGAWVNNNQGNLTTNCCSFYFYLALFFRAWFISHPNSFVSILSQFASFFFFFFDEFRPSRTWCRRVKFGAESAAFCIWSTCMYIC